jgi:hypothetical protein
MTSAYSLAPRFNSSWVWSCYLNWKSELQKVSITRAIFFYSTPEEELG